MPHTITDVPWIFQTKYKEDDTLVKYKAIGGFTICKIPISHVFKAYLNILLSVIF